MIMAAPIVNTATMMAERSCCLGTFRTLPLMKYLATPIYSGHHSRAKTFHWLDKALALPGSAVECSSLSGSLFENSKQMAEDQKL